MEALRIKYSVLFYWLLIVCSSFADSYVELEIEPNKDRSANLCFVFHDDDDSKARFLTTAFDAEVDCAFPHLLVEAENHSQFDETLHGWYLHSLKSSSDYGFMNRSG